MNEKDLLQKQKDDFQADVKNFKEQVIDKIAHVQGKDEFDSLYVFGNFYKLATESTPVLKEKFEEYNADKKKREKEISNINKEIEISTQNALESENIKIDVKSESYGRDSTFYNIEIFADNNLIFEVSGFNEGKSTQEYLNNLLNYKNKVDKDVMNEYTVLKDKLNNENGIFKKARNKTIQSKINKLAEENYHLRNYLKIEPYLNNIKSAYDKILQNKNLEEKLQDLTKINNKENSMFKKVLDKKATTVLALKYISLYNKNFDYLRMNPNGAKQTLSDILLKDAEYYARAAVERVANKTDEWLKISNIASTFHNKWREGRKNQDGKYEPRWKTVSDEAFINSVKSIKELPANIRIVDGKVEQDIANTNFNELCLDYQIENFEAAQVAYEVAQKDYTKSEAGKVGKIIHDEWLKRNPWAEGSELDVEFVDLINSEKVKDLIHYEIAKDIANIKPDINKIV